MSEQYPLPEQNSLKPEKGFQNQETQEEELPPPPPPEFEPRTVRMRAQLIAVAKQLSSSDVAGNVLRMKMLLGIIRAIENSAQVCQRQTITGLAETTGKIVLMMMNASPPSKDLMRAIITGVHVLSHPDPEAFCKQNPAIFETLRTALESGGTDEVPDEKKSLAKDEYLKFILKETPEVESFFPRLAQIREGIQAKSISDNSKAAENADALYWDMCKEIIKIRLGTGAQTDINFSLAEKLLINFGIFDEAIVFPENKISQFAQHYSVNQNHINTDIEIRYLTDLINIHNEKILNIKRQEKLQHQFEQCQWELSSLRKKLQELRARRSNLQKTALRNEKLDQIDSEMIKLHWELTEMDLEATRGIIKADRRIIAHKRMRLETLQEAKDFILMDLTKVGANKTIYDIDKNILKLTSAFQAIGYELYGILDEMEVDTKERTEYLTSNRRIEETNDEIKRLRQISKMVGKKSKLSQNPALATSKRIIGALEGVRILEEIIKFDVNIFDEPYRRKKGMPALCFWPGNGNGVYDYQTHSLIVPLCPVRTPEISITSAIAEWRIESDEEHKMQMGYLAAAKAPANTSIREYHTRFVNDYIQWLTIDSKGFQSLSTELRKWFKRNVGG